MRQRRWQRATEWPLVVAAVGFLVAWSWEVIADLTGAAARACEIVIWATWALFLVDFLVNLALAERRWHWFGHHLLDFAAVVLPFLRPLRLLRLVSLLSLLRREAGRAFRGRIVIFIIAATVLLIWAAAVAILDAERGQGGPIQTIWDALWWAFVTITTVGYGDYTPVTPAGRLVAIVIMIGGVALLGTVTATLASWIVDRVGAEAEAREEAFEQAEATEAATHVIESSEIAALRREIRALREDLRRRDAPVDS